MSQEKFDILAARVLSKEALPGEVVEFQQLVANNPDWEEVFRNMEELWHTGPEQQSNYLSSEESYLLHLGRLKDQAKDFEDYAEKQPVINEDFQLYPLKPWYKKWKAYAAVMIITAVSVFSYQFYSNSLNKKEQDNSKTLSLNEISVNPGAKTSLKLPDGSRVWVNSDSKLTYPESFTGALREVTLEGEAYFDIVKDPAHPFIVHTSGIDVRVLGTAFNVKAYQSEPTIEATLVHGMIEVTRKEQPNASKVILKPHEKLIFNKYAVGENLKRDLRVADKNTHLLENAGPAYTITPLVRNIADTAIIETSWVYNRLSFEDEKMEDLAKKMERWFNVRITFNNESIGSHRLTGSFQDETLEEALKELQYLVSFQYKLTGKEVVISKK